MTIDGYQALDIEELRGRLLQYTRQAYQMLSLPPKPRILDIGCGSGLPTLELARLSGGQIVAIDPDEQALSQLRSRVAGEGLTHQVSVHCRSFYESGCDPENFHLLWEEGVLHMLENERSFPECARLLKPGGFLVMHESISWFEKNRDLIPNWGFEHHDQLPLPRHYWLDHYAIPLEQRIHKLRTSTPVDDLPQDLARYEQDVATIKGNAEQLDSSFYIVQKRD